MVADLEYDIVLDWWHREAFLPLSRAIDPDSVRKTLRAIEASRGAGKSTLIAALRLYLAEYVLPFLQRKSLPIRAENRNMVLFGRTETHIRDDILGPMVKLIVERAWWLKTNDWQAIIDDIDNPSPEGLRAISEMRSKGGQKWEALRLDLSNGVSIRTRTLRQSVRGLHVLYADMDDPLTEENAHESQAILSLIQGAILPAIEPGGLFLLLGTPQMLGDLFDLVRPDQASAGQGGDWRHSAYPAYDLDGTLGYAAKNAAHMGPLFAALPAKDRPCLWPARLPWDALEQSRGSTRESESKYLREFLLQRVTDDSALVHYDHIVAARDPSISYHTSAQPNHHYKGAVDPSKLKRDEAAFCVGYTDKDGTIIPAAFSTLAVNPRLPLGVPEMKVVEELNSLATIFKCYDWKVESNGFQSAVAPLTKFVNVSVRFTDFSLGSNKHTENGWAGLRTTFRSRKIRLPYATPSDRATTDRVVHQLRGLQYVDGKVVEDPKRPNDLVSALFLLIKSCEEAPPQYSLTALSAQPAPGQPATAVALPGQAFSKPFSRAPGDHGELRGAGRPHAPTPTLQSTWARVGRWSGRR